MPETACLHIQARESDPVRVVDLRGGPVRVGRAAYCDVRIAEPELADEECRLRRRGSCWQLVPIADRGSVRLDGRPVEGPVTLSFGMTFEVGTQRLTLRPSPTSTPWPDRPPPAADEPTGRELAAPLRADWQARGDSNDRWDRAQKESKRWEARWRAAGEKLRAAPSVAAVPVTAPPPVRPAAPTVETRVARRPAVRRASPVTPPVAPGPDSAPPRPAGYVSPETPDSRREPVRSSAWAYPATEQRPAPPEPVRVSRPEPPPAPPRVERASRPVEPPPRMVVDAPREAVEPLTPAGVPDPLPPPASRTTDVMPASAAETGPEVPRGDQVGLENADFEALLSRLQTLILADVPPTSGVDESEGQTVAGVPPVSVEPEPGSLTQPVMERSVSPVLTPAGPGDEVAAVVGDEEEDRENEPETMRPPLGATRRGSTASRPTASEAPAPAARHGRRSAATPTVERGVRAEDGWAPRNPSQTDSKIAPPGAVEVGPASIADVGRPAREPREPASSREWPTVSEILAAQGARPRAAAATRVTPKGRESRPVPTVPREPGQWRLPLWLAWLPASAAAVGVGAAGLTGAWAWSVDGYNAGVVAGRLADAEPSRTPLPSGVTPPAGSWWTTSATHLVQWAAYLDRAGGDPSGAAEARTLLGRAAGVAPLNPTVRYALARPLPGESVTPSQSLARGLGQSRDVPALSWAGRKLLAAGKKESALRAFRASLEMATRADVARPGVPTFLDDPQTRRYALPAEDLIAAVVREMAGTDAWAYKEWSGALPPGTAAAAVAARVLRESGSPDAGAALDAALAEAETAPVTGSATDEAVRLAAGAEASAMKRRWAEARDRYRRAVDLMPVETVRRAWWFNLADLASRLDEDSERQKALEAAKVADLKDEITRRVVDLQRASGAVARRGGGRVAGATSGAGAEARR